MNAVDTNILIYAHDPRDPIKQNRAVELIDTLSNGVLLWQVACEYVAASRKLAAYGLNQQQVFTDLNRLRRKWTLAISNWAVLDRAETLMSSGNLSFWDALIVAACVENKVTQLYSEDFDASTSALTGVAIINPFI
ncbi:MAG TPA: PIN domain-containing protein [Blastocatellia bacterium]|nr:PIN domain-containing protein [Blastocatellia bacterium]HMV86018.1 PIN domain-containing protein [Blastocatellia bacterium]HMX30487.1 PIN domain-containing protein [Blastocatellia bacterium]HMY70594.1 PIN domain-containing protein [Blastocatellia bacterium]HMZ21791.1 PIN domain-containing protein [Blastocatellia bacterium]